MASRSRSNRIRHPAPAGIAPAPGLITPARSDRCWRTLWTVLLALALLAGAPTWAAGAPAMRGGRYALIVTVANYAGGLPRLPGAARDAERAHAIARAAGVPDDNIVTLRDREASADGIRRALTELALRLAPADRVLVYLSGLGSRRQDLDRPGQCEQVFLAAGGEPLGYGELAGMTIPVAERAEKTMVFFDSCDAPRRSGPLAARCVAADAGIDCHPQPSTRWRNFTTDIRQAAVPTANIVSVHAGRPDETVFDDASGGLFTTAIERCALADPADAASLAALAACAQPAIDRRAGGAGKGGQITLNGNQGFVPFMQKGAGQGALTRLFEDLAAGRDGRKGMVLEAIRAPSDIDGPAVSLRSAAVGYLYLLQTEAGGNARLVYPLLADGSNRVRAGETVTFPRKPGRSALVPGATLLAILADNERNLGMLPAAPGAAFAADGAGRKALYDFTTTSLRAAEAPCQASGRARNLSLWRGCSDAYGAAVLVIPLK